MPSDSGARYPTTATWSPSCGDVAAAARSNQAGKGASILSNAIPSGSCRACTFAAWRLPSGNTTVTCRTVLGRCSKPPSGSATSFTSDSSAVNRRGCPVRAAMKAVSSPTLKRLVSTKPSADTTSPVAGPDGLRRSWFTSSVRARAAKAANCFLRSSGGSLSQPLRRRRCSSHESLGSRSGGQVRSTSTATRNGATAAAALRRPASGGWLGGDSAASTVVFTSPDFSGANFSRRIAIGTATPCHRRGDTATVITPTTRPAASTSGPPSEPRLTAAVVSITRPAKAASGCFSTS